MAKVITPRARASYPKLFVPEVVENEKGKREKYGIALVFDPGADLKQMKQEAFGVAVEKFGEAKAKEMLANGKLKFIGGPKHAFRNDGEEKGYAEGSIYINANSYGRRPGVVDQQLAEITDPEKIYPGAYVKASVAPYWYNHPTGSGIAWALNNVQLVGDGERLDGRMAAKDEFEAIEPTDLEDLEGELEGADEDLEEQEEVEEAPAPKPVKKGKAKAAKKSDDVIDELLG